MALLFFFPPMDVRCVSSLPHLPVGCWVRYHQNRVPDPTTRSLKRPRVRRPRPSPVPSEHCRRQSSAGPLGAGQAAGTWGVGGGARGLGGGPQGSWASQGRYGLCWARDPSPLPSAPPSPFLRTRCRRPRRFGGACAFWAQPGSAAVMRLVSIFFFFSLIWETPGNRPAPLLVRYLDQSGKLPRKVYAMGEPRNGGRAGLSRGGKSIIGSFLPLEPEVQRRAQAENLQLGFKKKYHLC